MSDHPLLDGVKPLEEIYKIGLQYVKDRYDGRVKSIRTPWKCMDDATLDGLEWGSVMVLAARPGCGKTTIVNLITRQAHDRNPDQDFLVLDFQFEMTDKATAVRDFSYVMKKTYQELASVGQGMSTLDILKLDRHVQAQKNLRIFQQSHPLTVERIRTLILEFISRHRKPVIVTIDHSMLIASAPGSHNDFGKLFELGLMVSELKRSSPVPIIFIILTQMNRGIEERNSHSAANGDTCNYPNSSDVYGGDALLMTTDLLVAVNRPAQMHLKHYGPQKYVVTKELLVFHFLKSRTGTNDMFFFKEDFQNYNIIPINPPATDNTAAGPILRRQII